MKDDDDNDDDIKNKFLKRKTQLSAGIGSEGDKSVLYYSSLD